MKPSASDVKAYPVSKPLSRLAKTGVIAGADLAAAIDIECAVISILSNDIRSDRHDRPEALPQTRQARDRLLRFFEARQAYYDWIDAMAGSGLPAGPVLDVIVEGKPLTSVDRAWRRRKGWARGLLLKALRLYREIRREREKMRLTA